MSRPPRIEGFSYIGPYRYFATFCTVDRREVFLDIPLGQSAIRQFRRTCRRWKSAMLAYCIMPDHIHLLVEGISQESDFRWLLKSLKQSSGQTFAARARQQLWQEGYYDRVLREDDDVKAVARYIIENPVRAGLVRSPLEYPLVGSDRWKVEELIDSLW
jgi:putative transposase